MQLAVLGATSSLFGSAGMRLALLGASVAGSLLFGGRKKPVGKINDLRVSSSSYGRGIARVWGTMRVTGNMFWATDFKEEKVYVTQKGKQKTGTKGQKKGKKGKATLVYRYSANFAMGLCAGPVDEVIRIWADNNLIYNKYNPDDKDLVTPGFSQREDDNTGKGSLKSGAGKKGSGAHSGRFAFRFYPGDEEQMPDPYMESKEGTGNCPAYRGLAYLMFQDFSLEDFGNRIPTITAEVTTKGITRPQVMEFTNNPPPVEGWWSSIRAPYMLDIVRENFYVGCLRTRGSFGGDNGLRIYDMTTRKETGRLFYRDVMPQTAPHGDEYIGSTGAFGLGLRTWTVEDGENFRELGMTGSGDLILWRNQGNHSPIIFMDPQSGRIIKSWGRSGVLLGGAWDALFVPGGAFPVIGQDRSGKPVIRNCVYSAFGDITIFDETYNKVGMIHCDGRRTNHVPGAYGTDYAMFFTTTDFAGTSQFRFYKAACDTPDTYKDLGSEMPHTTEIEFARWPAVAGSKGNVLVMDYFSYVVGVQAVCAIFTGSPKWPWAVKIDPISGDILWEKELVGVDIQAFLDMKFEHPPNYNNTNYTNFQSVNQQVKIDWHLEEVSVESFFWGGLVPLMDLKPRYYWSEKDAHLGFMQADGGMSGEWRPIMLYMDRKVQENVDLATICRDVSTLVGISQDQINTAGLQTQEPLNGYMVEQPTEARAILEELANVYQFDVVESDYTLNFKMRGGSPVRTINEEMLGIVDSTDFGTDNERVVETIQHQLELPERVTVSYFDPKNEYETGSQYFKRPVLPIPVVSTREHLEVTFNMALLNKNAKSLAKRLLYAAWSERHTLSFKLPRDYLQLDPSDVVALNLDDGRTLEVRITDITTGANMELDVAGVVNFADSYTQTATTDTPGGIVSDPPTKSGFARPLLFDIPYLEDSQQNPNTNLGYYWAAAAYGTGFNFGMLQSRFDDTGWQTEGVTQLDALWGYVNGVVPAPGNGWNIEDTTTKIKLVPAFDFNASGVVYSWESIPEEEWPSEQNMVIIGNEIILFKDVEEHEDGSVTISRLIRGYRGSIDAAYKHVGTDAWALVTEGTIFRGDDTLDYYNQDQYFIVNSGLGFSMLSGQTRHKLIGSTEKPLPPGDVRRVNNANGSVTFSWSRATRIGGAFRNGTGVVPLNEESEKYHLFILAAPYNAKTWDPNDATKYIFKSSELTSSAVTISQATLTSLGLTNTVDLHIVIHQMSATVEYGYPHGLTVPYARIGV